MRLAHPVREPRGQAALTPALVQAQTAETAALVEVLTAVQGLPREAAEVPLASMATTEVRAGAELLTKARTGQAEAAKAVVEVAEYSSPAELAALAAMAEMAASMGVEVPGEAEVAETA